MVRPTTHRLTAPERKARIDLAATRLFAQRGFAATTVEDIVREAGVTKPMLYRHYESKRELCVALLERYRDELGRAPLAQFDPASGDLPAQLGPMLDAWLEYVEEHPDATRLLFVPVVDDPEVARVQRELHARQRAMQMALLREFAPGLVEAEAEPLAEAMRSSLAAVALWWLDHPEVPREVPTRALRHLAEGTVNALRGANRGVR